MFTLILTILVDLYKKKISYKPRWLKYLRKSYELSKMSIEKMLELWED
jgi:hypothetical protein